jgi:SAM-dependent methyltransferase
MHPDEYRRTYDLEEVHWWHRGLQSLVLSLLDRYLPRSHRRPSILDAGCGTGGMSSAMERLATVTGLDLFPQALEFCRTRGLERLVAGTVEAVPFAEASFDAVVSLDVLYHAAVTDDQSAVHELVRVLRPGGVLIVNLPAYNWLRGEHDLVVQTARRYTRRRVRELFHAAGLSPVWLSHWNGLLLPLAVSVRMAQRFAARHREPQSDIGPVHPVLNRALMGVLAMERRLIGVARLPFGLSVLAVGIRPSEG